MRAHVAVEDPSRTDIFDQMAVQKILDHLGLSSPQAEKPPPPPREVLRVAEHGDGWGTPQQWDPA